MTVNQSIRPNSEAGPAEHPQSDWMSADFEPGLVSVIVPTYNRAKMVLEAMDSVFAQTYRPIEMIVVDDGSTDDTRQQVELWGKSKHSVEFRVQYIHQENAGSQVARNLGLTESKGEFIQFLDSDDLLLPYKLASQVSSLNASGADLVYCLTRMLGPNGKTMRVFGLAPETCRSGAWISMHAWHTISPLMRRHLCMAVGPWDEELQGCQEYEYAARIKAAHFDIQFTNDILVNVRDHGQGSITTQSSLRYAGALALAAEKVLNHVEAVSTANHRSEREEIARGLTHTALRFARCGANADAIVCLRRARAIACSWRRMGLYCLLLGARAVPLLTILEFLRIVRDCGKLLGGRTARRP